MHPLAVGQMLFTRTCTCTSTGSTLYNYCLMYVLWQCATHNRHCINIESSNICNHSVQKCKGSGYVWTGGEWQCSGQMWHLSSNMRVVTALYILPFKSAK